MHHSSYPGASGGSAQNSTPIPNVECHAPEGSSAAGAPRARWTSANGSSGGIDAPGSRSLTGRAAWRTPSGADAAQAGTQRQRPAQPDGDVRTERQTYRPPVPAARSEASCDSRSPRAKGTL